MYTQINWPVTGLKPARKPFYWCSEKNYRLFLVILLLSYQECLPFSQKNVEILVESQMELQFSGTSVRKTKTTFRSSPLFPLGTGWREFLSHLLNLVVSILSSA